jgi:hypothetical protein
MNEGVHGVRLTDIEDNRYTLEQRLRLVSQNRFIQKTLLPIHFCTNMNGNSVTLDQFIATSAALSTSEASNLLGLGQTTMRQNIPVAIACISNIYGLSISVNLDDKNSRKVEKVIEQYRNYEMYRKLIQSDAFKIERPFFDKLLIGGKDDKFIPLLDAVRQLHGWDTPKITGERLASQLGDEDYVAAQVEGGKQFLNMVFGTQFTVIPSQKQESAVRVLLVRHDRFHQASELLFQYRDTLIPIEIYVIEEYLKGHYYNDIKQSVGNNKNGLGTLDTAPGSVSHFLNSVFELNNDVSPFIRIWLAEEARKYLQKPVPDPFAKNILVGLMRGKSFAQIASEQDVSPSAVSQTLYDYGIVFSEAFQRRKDKLSSQRVNLLQSTYLIQSDWPEKEKDVAVIEYLTGVRIPNGIKRLNKNITFTQIAEELHISYHEVALSVARVRTIIRREIYKLEEEKESQK